MTDRKVLLVVDPSKRDNKTLKLIEGVLKRFSRAGEFELVTLITPNLDDIDAGASNITVDQSWLDCLTETIAACDQKYSVQVAWARDWSDTVLQHIREHQITLSIIPFYGHRAKNILSDQKWKFLRNTDKPVLLTNGRRASPSNIVLAAIKAQDPEYEYANQKVLLAVRKLAEQVGSEVHVVNAYSGSMNYPDRAKIITMTKIDNERIHVEEGSPKEVLRDIAQKLDADAIYISNHQRKGITGSLHANTVEKILAATDCDIVMV